MSEQRQARQIDGLLSLQGTVRHDLRVHRAARPLLVRMVNFFRNSTEKARDACPRGKDVGDHARAADLLEHQHRRAALRGERPDQRRDFLVGGDFLGYGEYVVGIPAAVVVEEAVEVLAHFTSRCSFGGRNSAVKMSAAFGLLVNLKAMPTWSMALSRRFMSTPPKPLARTSSVR